MEDSLSPWPLHLCARPRTISRLMVLDLVIAAIRGVNKLMGNLSHFLLVSPCNSAFQIYTYMCEYIQIFIYLFIHIKDNNSMTISISRDNNNSI